MVNELKAMMVMDYIKKWISSNWRIALLLTGVFVIITAFVTQTSHTVVAAVTNFESNEGVCYACLYNNATAFSGDGGQPYQCKQVIVQNKKAVVTFDQLPAGNYALLVFHDKNKNGKMDRNFLGIPKEGYGASLNKLPFASAPTYEDNMFVLSQAEIKTLSIKLRNL